jgi:hypothetical protein
LRLLHSSIAVKSQSPRNPYSAANSAIAGQTGAITLRDRRRGSAARPPMHLLTASCTHTASDFFVILIDRGVEDFSGVLRAP